MDRHSLKRQLKDNMVAIISLVIAIVALLYTGWREETTEKNRTLRTAGFEVLKNLGELQIVVNYAYYQHDDAKGNPYLGWGHIALISDLAVLLPSPIPQTIAKLVKDWGELAQKINNNEEAVDLISSEIDASRHEVLQAIRYLR